MKELLYESFMEVRAFVRRRDIFGKPITITYGKQEKFKTHIGGVATFALLGFLFGYGIYMTYIMITRSIITSTVNSIVKDLTRDNSVHEIAKDGFAVAVGLREFGKFDASTTLGDVAGLNILDDVYKNYVELKILQYDKATVNGVSSTVSTELELEKWGDNYPYEDKALYKKYNINTYACIKKTDYKIQGNWYSDDNKSIHIWLKRCDSTTNPNCKTSAEIDTFIKGHTMEVVMVNSYFDLHDFGHPVRNHLTENYYYKLDVNYFSNEVVLIRHNEVTLKDYIVGTSSENKVFYSVSRGVENNTPTVDNYLAWIELRLDPMFYSYSRTVYSFLDMVAQLGGLFGAFGGLCGLLLGIYSRKKLQHSILRKCYEIDCEEKIKEIGNNKRKLSCYIKKKEENTIGDENLNNPTKKVSTEEPILTEQNETEQTKNLSDTQLKKLAEKLKSRKRFAFRRKDFLYNVFCCVKKRFFCCKGERNNVYDNSKLFNKGLEKYFKDLDLVSIIKTSRRMNVVIDVLFNERQKMLEKFSKVHCIDLDTSEKINEFSFIPRYKSKNKGEKFGKFYQKIDEFVDQMSRQELTSTDHTLLKHIYGSSSLCQDEDDKKALASICEESRENSPVGKTIPGFSIKTPSQRTGLQNSVIMHHQKIDLNDSDDSDMEERKEDSRNSNADYDSNSYSEEYGKKSGPRLSPRK